MLQLCPREVVLKVRQALSRELDSKEKQAKLSPAFIAYCDGPVHHSSNITEKVLGNVVCLIHSCRRTEGSRDHVSIGRDARHSAEPQQAALQLILRAQTAFTRRRKSESPSSGVGIRIADHEVSFPLIVVFFVVFFDGEERAEAEGGGRHQPLHRSCNP